jgi:hypothetical protein
MAHAASLAARSSESQPPGAGVAAAAVPSLSDGLTRRVCPNLYKEGAVQSDAPKLVRCPVTGIEFLLTAAMSGVTLEDSSPAAAADTDAGPAAAAAGQAGGSNNAAAVGMAASAAAAPSPHPEQRPDSVGSRVSPPSGGSGDSAGNAGSKRRLTGVAATASTPSQRPRLSAAGAVLAGSLRLSAAVTAPRVKPSTKTPRASRRTAAAAAPAPVAGGHTQGGSSPTTTAALQQQRAHELSMQGSSHLSCPSRSMRARRRKRRHARLGAQHRVTRPLTTLPSSRRGPPPGASQQRRAALTAAMPLLLNP